MTTTLAKTISGSEAAVHDQVFYETHERLWTKQCFDTAVNYSFHLMAWLE